MVVLGGGGLFLMSEVPLYGAALGGHLVDVPALHKLAQQPRDRRRVLQEHPALVLGFRV